MGSMTKIKLFVPESEKKESFDLEEYYIEDSFLPETTVSTQDENMTVISQSGTKNKIDSSTQCPPFEVKQTNKEDKIKMSQKKPCTFHFSSGGCRYGAGCFFSHTIPPKKISKFCWFEKYRTCHFGIHCWYKHRKKDIHQENKSERNSTRKKSVILEMEKIKVKIRKLNYLVKCFKKEKNKVHLKSKKFPESLGEESKENLSKSLNNKAQEKTGTSPCSQSMPRLNDYKDIDKSTTSTDDNIIKSFNDVKENGKNNKASGCLKMKKKQDFWSGLKLHYSEKYGENLKKI